MTELSNAVNGLVNQTRLAYIISTAVEAVICMIIGLVLALWVGGTFGTILGTFVGTVLFILLVWLFAKFIEPYFVSQGATVTAVGAGTIPPQSVALSPLTISNAPKV